MKPILKKWYIDNHNGDLNWHSETETGFFTIRLSTRKNKIDKGSLDKKELISFFKDINKINSGRIVLLKKAALSKAKQRKILKLLFEEL